jgi:branched-chain amino acid aminotransferase
MDTQAWWYVSGKWVHPHEATISLNDVGILRGYSAFEALRTYDRRPFHLEEHLNRLFHSAQLIDLDMPFTHEFIVGIIHQVIERNPYKHASLRILVTGGETEDGIVPTGNPHMAIMISQLGERDMERFARGVKLITTHLMRMTPEAKTSNYVSAIRSLKQAARHDATDALFVNERDHVLESTRSNFFVFRGDTLITPREGVLLGVTRNTALELAAGRFAVEERPILLSELSEIDEAFITSSSKEITPIVQIDEIVIGGGKSGPRTSELEQRFIAMIERGEW